MLTGRMVEHNHSRYFMRKVVAVKVSSCVYGFSKLRTTVTMRYVMRCVRAPVTVTAWYRLWYRLAASKRAYDEADMFS